MPTNGAQGEWTVATLKVYSDTRDEMNERFQAERDRRYAEVAAEREKALEIKNTADERALLLQAETQKYKDEKANELRSQIERERGGYATKSDLVALSEKFDTAHRPVVEFMAQQFGRSAGAANFKALLIVIAAVITTVLVAVEIVIAVVVHH
jgi:aminopeptidase N